MHDEASSLDIHHLAKELTVLEGGKVNKVYEWEDQEAFIFKIYSDGETHHLRLKLPGLLYTTERRFQAPKIPPGYARFLRNQLTASRIKTVSQHSFDRLLEFEIHSKRHGELTLIFELFKPANIVLMDDNNTIIHPYRQQTFKDRTIRSNKPYRYPPERPDTPSLTVSGLSEMLEGEDNVERVVATRLGLGGVYASEVTARTDVNPDIPADELSERQKTMISESIQAMLDETEPRIIDGEAYPIRMQSLPDSAEQFTTFSDALDTVHDYDQVIKHGSSSTDKQEKYQTIIEAQEKQINQFEEAIEENQRKANYIYENYNDFATMIYELRDRQQEGELEAALEEIDKAVDYDPSTNEVTLEFDDETTS